MHYSKSTPFAVSEMKWGTKENKGSYIYDVHIVHTAVPPEGTSPDEAISNSEKNQPVALAACLKAY